MSTDGQREDQVDEGHLAVLGHRLLGSAAVVTGALATLRDSNGSVPAGQRARLEDEVEQSLASIMEIARTLIHGGPAGGEPATFCAQCYGKEVIRVAGKTVPCTCVSWPRIVGVDGGSRGAARPRRRER